jgi:hypothetical protein
MQRRLAWAAALACVLLAACGEKPQTSGTRKADAAPSQGAVAAYTAPGWKPGDATSWEAQMKKRSDGQNEYTRTARK